jgi:hypothetical protein
VPRRPQGAWRGGAPGSPWPRSRRAGGRRRRRADTRSRCRVHAGRQGRRRPRELDPTRAATTYRLLPRPRSRRTGHRPHRRRLSRRRERRARRLVQPIHGMSSYAWPRIHDRCVSAYLSAGEPPTSSRASAEACSAPLRAPWTHQTARRLRARASAPSTGVTPTPALSSTSARVASRSRRELAARGADLEHVADGYAGTDWYPPGVPAHGLSSAAASRHGRAGRQQAAPPEVPEAALRIVLRIVGPVLVALALLSIPGRANADRPCAAPHPGG